MGCSKGNGKREFTRNSGIEMGLTGTEEGRQGRKAEDLGRGVKTTWKSLTSLLAAPAKGFSPRTPVGHKAQCLSRDFTAMH